MAGTTQLKSVIEQFSPHYNFGEQTIGFKIFKDASPEDMDKYDNYLPNLQLSKTEEKVKGTEPDAFISTYELRNLFFYQYLHKSYHDEAKTKRLIETCAEQFLVDYIANIKRFFEDVKEGRFEPIVAPPDFTKNESLPFLENKKQQTLLRKEYKNKQVDMVLRKELLTERVKKDYAIGYTSLPHDIRE